MGFYRCRARMRVGICQKPIHCSYWKNKVYCQARVSDIPLVIGRFLSGDICPFSVFIFFIKFLFYPVL
jgi:hypothetical protein